MELLFDKEKEYDLEFEDKEKKKEKRRSKKTPKRQKKNIEDQNSTPLMNLAEKLEIFNRALNYEYRITLGDTFPSISLSEVL